MLLSSVRLLTHTCSATFGVAGSLSLQLRSCSNCVQHMSVYVCCAVVWCGVLQMLGRGLRIFPSKKDCLVLDFTDKYHTVGTRISRWLQQHTHLLPFSSALLLAAVQMQHGPADTACLPPLLCAL